MSKIRELVLDTETTGFYPEKGDKIVEVAVIELINHLPTKNFFHVYVNPERTVPDGAFKVHGLNYDFLKNKPTFSQIADEFLDFIGYDKLIIHNASFDLKFLNFELNRVNKKTITTSQAIDTLKLARDQFPGSPASLDALCRRFSIDRSNRELHGALIDSDLLAQVYLELIGGRQPDLTLNADQSINNKLGLDSSHKAYNFHRTKILPDRVSAHDARLHRDFIKKINGLENWKIYTQE